MRVLQLIDSLEAGGAERMAVNLANSLSDNIESSYICASRKEGLLKDSISTSVGYLHLNRKSVLDLNSIISLYRYVKSEKISIIHAHSSSFFLGTLIKILYPKVRLIWHDHYGNSELLEERPYRVLKLCSRFFDTVLCVNSKLMIWNKKVLRLNSISYFSNFVLSGEENNMTTKLFGADGKRILCLANLRSQKDHFNLLSAFKGIHLEYPDWTLHLVGKDFNDDYSAEVRAFIHINKLGKKVFLYGSKSDTQNIINQSAIGVLSSKSEGLPLALIEYGYGGLAVISTNVGDCRKVIADASKGLLVESSNIKEMRKALTIFMENEKLRTKVGESLQKHVHKYFSKDSVIESLLLTYNKVLS